MENAVEAVGLSKRFRVHRERRTLLKERLIRGRASTQAQYFWALKDATFSVPRGSSLGLIGHNGSGKSTALKVMTGIYRPTEGHVTVNGSVSALLEVGAGFHPELTGRENIRLNATILGFTTKQINALMDQIIEFADIGDFIDSPVKHYSSGMYVRLGFAVAVMVRPEILIVDEVIAVGDEEFQRKCFDYLHGLRKQGTSMIIVSHGLSNITDLCDEAIWLEHGHMRDIGPSADVTRAYLDDVNAREIARAVSAQPVGDEPPADTARRGSGEIRFRGLEPFADGDTSAGVIISGSAARLRVHYEAREPVSDAIVEVTFSDTQQLPVLSLSTQSMGPLSIPRGRGHLDFVTDAFLLLSGSYDVAVTISAEGRTLDAVPDAAEVVVRAQGIESGGTYLQHGRWELGDG